MRLDSRNNLFSATITHYCVRRMRSRFEYCDTRRELQAMTHLEKKDEF